jgi:hypothetical protein
LINHNPYADERGDSIEISNIEIVIDEDNPGKVEIYMLDETGSRQEGGTFDKQAFMQVVRTFYDNNY